MQKEEFNHLLDDLPLGEVRYLPEIPSTNASALEWLSAHPLENSLLLTDRQTSGYGRFKRPWHAAAGASLTFSLILYPTPIEQDRLPFFSALAALSIVQAVDSFQTAVATQIKWPNDVLLDGEKCAGVLCEATWQNDQLSGLVVGMGINVGKASIPSSGELLFPAVCLQDALQMDVERWDVLHRVLQNFFSLRDIFPSPEFLDLWRSRLAFLEQLVTITTTENEQTNGIFVGAADNGDLILEQKSGRRCSFPLGDVSLRPHHLK